MNGKVYIAPKGTALTDVDGRWVEVEALHEDAFPVAEDSSGHEGVDAALPSPRALESQHATEIAFAGPIPNRVVQLIRGNITPPALPPYRGLREAADRMEMEDEMNRWDNTYASVIGRALADPEGQQLVQDIIDRKQAR